MILADTNVVSEFMRERPDPRVAEWAARLQPTAVVICVVTVEEIERGIGRLADGRRRSELQSRWSGLLDAYADSILAYDVQCARMTAQVLVEREKAGRPMALADAQIAGIALVHGCILATRNVADFGGIPSLELVDPVASEP